MLSLTFSSQRLYRSLLENHILKASNQYNVVNISNTIYYFGTLYSLNTQKSLYRYNSTQFFFGFNTITPVQEDTQSIFFSLQSSIKIKF